MTPTALGPKVLIHPKNFNSLNIGYTSSTVLKPERSTAACFLYSYAMKRRQIRRGYPAGLGPMPEKFEHLGFTLRGADKAMGGIYWNPPNGKPVLAGAKLFNY
jgi:hypothetical protein